MPAISLDELDRRILACLQDDANMHNNVLAQRVHASAATCLRRVKRLIELEVIERVVAIVRPDAVGMSLAAIVEITLDHQGNERHVAFETLAAAEPSILQCYRVGGAPDFVLIVQVEDMVAYQQFAHRMLGVQANVRNVRTFFSTHRSKFETRMTIPAAPLA